MMGEEEAAGMAVGELVRKEVRDWDDDVTVSARFKAFSGQRSDYESVYQFWRDLIVNIARRLGLFIVSTSQVKNVWFNRGGLTPLCLDHVLLEMYNSGEILGIGDLPDPRSGRLTQFLKKAVNLVRFSRSSSPVCFTEDHFIISTLLIEKADEAVNALSDNHWSSSCIVTLSKLNEICGGTIKASAVLSQLSKIGKAKCFSLRKDGAIEGVKISLSAEPVPKITSLDCHVLQLTWTAEKLQRQIFVLDQHCDKSKRLALACLQSGNKSKALGHARKLKIASQSWGKCTSLLNRVEEVLKILADAEDLKEVAEAIQVGAKAMKENRVTEEEVRRCLMELEDRIDSQMNADKCLASYSLYSGVEDEHFEDELEKLLLEDENSPVQGTEAAQQLSTSLSNLKLNYDADKDSLPPDSEQPVNEDVPLRISLLESTFD